MTALTAYDGLVGAAINGGRLIITSPNQNEIFNPPLGGDRNVFLRSDLLFGDDDPLQWPQSFLRQYSHLACIRKRPEKEIPFSIMWWLPDRRAFDDEKLGVLTGVGRLHWSFFERIKGFASTAIERSKRNVFEGTPLVWQLSNTLEDLVHRLKHVSTSFRTMQLGVRATQRVFLELTALLDFLEIYQPVLTGDSPPETIPKVAKMIGAFTSDPTVCRYLYLAKIPVWFLRPHTALHSIRITAIAPVQYAQGTIALDPPIRPSYPPIFRGAYGVGMYTAFAQYILGYFRYPDPFAFVRAISSVNPPAPAPEPSKREIRTQRYAPCEYPLHLV